MRKLSEIIVAVILMFTVISESCTLGYAVEELSGIPPELKSDSDNVIRFFDSDEKIGKLSGGVFTDLDDEHKNVIQVKSGDNAYFYADKIQESYMDIFSFDIMFASQDATASVQLFDPVIDEKESDFDKFKRMIKFEDTKLGFTTSMRTDTMQTRVPTLKFDKFANQWYNISYCIDYSTKKIYSYINGTRTASIELAEDYPISGGMRLVCDPQDSNSFTYIDNVKMFHILKRGLSLDGLDGDIVYPEYVGTYADITTTSLGSIMFDRKAEYSVHITNPYDGDANFNINCSVVTEHGYTERSYEKKAFVKAGESKDIPLSIETDGYGYYKLYVDITDDYAERTLSHEKIFSMCRQSKSVNPKMGVYSSLVLAIRGGYNRLFDNGYSVMPEKMELFAKAGFSSWRDNYNWQSIDAGTSSPSFISDDRSELYQRISKMSLDYGMNNMWTLQGNKYGEFPPKSPQNISFFAEYAKKLVELNQNPNDIYEVWNEPNLGHYNTSGATVQDYINMQKVVYETIKAYKPDTTVIGMGGPTNIANIYDWVEEYFELGGYKYCEGLSIHPYAQNMGPSELSLDCIKKVKAIMEKYNCEDIPLYASECGFSSTNALLKGSKDVQFAIMAAPELEMMHFFCAQENEHDTMVEKSFGLIRSWDEEHTFGYEPYSAKPSFIGLAAYNYLFNGSHDQKEVNTGNSDICVTKAINASGNSLSALWCRTFGKVETATFKINGDSVKLYDMYGNEKICNLSDGLLTINLTFAPQYIEGTYTEISYLDNNPVSVNVDNLNEFNVVAGDLKKIYVTGNVEDGTLVNTKMPKNLVVVENNGFADGKAELIIKANNEPTDNERMVIEVCSDKVIYGVFEIDVVYDDTVVTSLMPSYFRNGRWQYEIKVYNNRTRDSLSGHIKINKPKNIMLISSQTEFKDIPAQSSKKIYIDVPTDLVDVKTTLSADIVLDTGETHKLKDDIYFSAIVYTKKAPIIDGVIDDEWYKNTPFQLKYNSQNYVKDWKGTNDVSGNIYCMYDDDNFYIAGVVIDDKLGCSSTEIWENDSIQFAFAESKLMTARRTEYGIGLVNGEPQVIRYSYMKVATGMLGVVDNYNYDGIEYSVKRDEVAKRTYYEMKVPWSQIYADGFKPADYESLLFSMLVNDNDGSGRRGWIEYCPGIGKSKNPEQFINTRMIRKSKLAY